jgi:TatD DNase family protein
MQFTDSHIHLQDYNANNTQQIIDGLLQFGFVRLVCVSAYQTDWQKVETLYQKNAQTVIPAFGVHPWYLTQAPENWPNLLSEKLDEYPMAWIGECGLDFLKCDLPRDIQLQAFEQHIDLANRKNRPLNVHLLKAENEMRSLLSGLSVPFVLHSFGSATDFLRQALKFGAYISVSPRILERKNGLEIIRQTPLESLLFESDAPYQSKPEQIAQLAEAVAQIKQCQLAQVVERVCQNLEKCHYGN